MFHGPASDCWQQYLASIFTIRRHICSQAVHSKVSGGLTFFSLRRRWYRRFVFLGCLAFENLSGYEFFLFMINGLLPLQVFCFVNQCEDDSAPHLFKRNQLYSFGLTFLQQQPYFYSNSLSYWAHFFSFAVMLWCFCSDHPQLLPAPFMLHPFSNSNWFIFEMQIFL